MEFTTNAQAHLFEAEKLEIEAEVLEAEADRHEATIEEIIREADDGRRKEIEKLEYRRETEYTEDPIARQTFKEVMQRMIESKNGSIGEATDESRYHENQVARLLNQATRLRARATRHRCRANEQ